jgi:hypothetical protein
VASALVVSQEPLLAVVFRHSERVLCLSEGFSFRFEQEQHSRRWLNELSEVVDDLSRTMKLAKGSRSFHDWSMPQVIYLDAPRLPKLSSEYPAPLRIVLTFIMSIVDPRDVNAMYTLHLCFQYHVLRRFWRVQRQIRSRSPRPSWNGVVFG